MRFASRTDNTAQTRYIVPCASAMSTMTTPQQTVIECEPEVATGVPGASARIIERRGRGGLGGLQAQCESVAGLLASQIR